MEYSLDILSQEQVKSVLRRNGEFVAVVGKGDMFLNVINRYALVEKLAVITGKSDR